MRELEGVLCRNTMRSEFNINKTLKVSFQVYKLIYFAYFKYNLWLNVRQVAKRRIKPINTIIS